jgi:hypothetical protein
VIIGFFSLRATLSTGTDTLKAGFLKKKKIHENRRLTEEAAESLLFNTRKTYGTGQLCCVFFSLAGKDQW